MQRMEAAKAARRRWTSLEPNQPHPVGAGASTSASLEESTAKSEESLELGRRVLPLSPPRLLHQLSRSFSTHLSSHVSCSSLVRYESTASVEPSEVEGHEADACESSATSCGADADSQSVLTPIVDSPVAAQLHWLQRREHSAGSALSTRRGRGADVSMDSERRS
jgi:hypothetical protein